MTDPSWSELIHFVQFLDLQLRSCEVSVFCNEELVRDVLAGLKTFIVKFMVRMSKVNSRHQINLVISLILFINEHMVGT